MGRRLNSALAAGEQLQLYLGKAPSKPRRKKPGPKRDRRSGSPHRIRPELNGRDPIHVILRVTDEVESLRKRWMYAAIREATIAVALRELAFEQTGAFRIVHISIQRDHVHLIVEAANKWALSRGMQSFQISAAKQINRAFSKKQKLKVRRRGSVFPDRFHQEVISTPRQARHALAYVLNNWRKHEQDRGEVQRTWKVDPFSTGATFSGWKELERCDVMWPLRETYSPLAVYYPKTWLLREGWRRHGLIRTTEVPGPRVAA